MIDSRRRDSSTAAASDAASAATASASLTKSQSVNFMKEAQRLKKQVKFVSSPSPISHDLGVMKAEVGTSTMAASSFPQLDGAANEGHGGGLQHRPPTPVFNRNLGGGLVMLDTIPGVSPNAPRKHQSDSTLSSNTKVRK